MIPEAHYVSTGVRAGADYIVDVVGGCAAMAVERLPRSFAVGAHRDGGSGRGYNTGGLLSANSHRVSHLRSGKSVDFFSVALSALILIGGGSGEVGSGRLRSGVSWVSGALSWAGEERAPGAGQNRQR